ncbi:sensor histidine kinase [Sphingomonas sp. CFBP 13720]|uniref:sensor histidine kinase n=1 Tax=Sphingomonas sp. CFBP 13720 TaxID=2775302 RepID=UPI001781C26F|nr:HAMP domain-containing sensor histidine kinase [Sphingomonas sp. CFBP 13720]MBD8677657.1 HAMP domain-containing histidine kinase [Sphingomonas sp. CFBP 13720]
MPRSIHGRMLALSAVTTLVALIVAFMVLGGVLGRFATDNVDRRLNDRLRLMGALVRTDGTIDRALLDRPNVETAFAADAAWRIDAPGGSIEGAALPGLAVRGDGRANLPFGPIGRSRHRRGPALRDGPTPFEAQLRDGTRVHGLSETIRSEAGPVRIAVAVPRWQIDAPLRGAMWPLIAMLAAVAALLTTATLVQLRIGLRPLRALRDRTADIRTGRARDVPEGQPDELRPLAIELNALVRDNNAALATARASAANLAHALKTPVATLALDLAGDPRARQVARIDATIRHHLSRARNATVDRRSFTPLRPAIDDLVATVGALHRGSGIAIVAADLPDMAVAIDAADLTELAGNLIDNAARHARSIVRVSAERADGTVTLSISDDGPGIPLVDRARATAPGVRLDERGDGHGFGLSIARDLAALYGSALTLDEAPGGGLLASVTLPVAASG